MGGERAGLAMLENMEDLLMVFMIGQDATPRGKEIKVVCVCVHVLHKALLPGPVGGESGGQGCETPMHPTADHHLREFSGAKPSI